MHGHLSLLFHLATVVFHFVIMLFSHCPCNFKIEQPFSPNIFEWAIYVPYYTNIYIYIYIYINSMLDIFTMIFLGTRTHDITKFYLMNSNQAWVQVFWIFTATFTLVEPTQPG